MIESQGHQLQQTASERSRRTKTFFQTQLVEGGSIWKQMGVLYENIILQIM